MLSIFLRTQTNRHRTIFDKLAKRPKLNWSVAASQDVVVFNSKVVDELDAQDRQVECHKANTDRNESRMIVWDEPGVVGLKNCESRFKVLVVAAKEANSP